MPTNSCCLSIQFESCYNPAGRHDFCHGCNTEPSPCMSPCCPDQTLSISSSSVLLRTIRNAPYIPPLLLAVTCRQNYAQPGLCGRVLLQRHNSTVRNVQRNAWLRCSGHAGLSSPSTKVGKNAVHWSAHSSTRYQHLAIAS